MKFNYKPVLLSLFMFLLLYSVQDLKAQAGDTLVVEWMDGGNFVKNALRLAIEADTLADGSRVPNRVYKLRAGGYYWNDETINNNGWHLNIVGETPDPSDPAAQPAVLQQVARGDGTLNSRMITGNGSITLKNLYLIGCDDTGAQGSLYQPIQIDASNSRFVIDHCIFERNNFAIIAWTGKGNDIFLTNNIYRNLLEYPPTQLWTGRGVSIWADQDSVVVENNTFFNIAFSAFQLESGAANYLRFNHNTIVNNGRGINTTPWLTEAYFANNLIINGFWDGEAHNRDELDGPNRDPRAYTSGIFSFGPLPTSYGLDQGREILFSHNAAWLDPAFETWYATNSIRKQPFVGPVTKEDFIDPYEGIVVGDTTWLEDKPDFPTYPTTDIFDNMTTYIDEIRASQYNSGPTPTTTYFWMYPTDGGDTCYTCTSWGTLPRGVPEDFSYTTTSLLTAGTDDLPLGDLNWFPTQKATFEANKAGYIAEIESMAEAPTFTYEGSLEAEDGTVGGDGAVKVAEGTKYYRMSNGFIKWDFDLATAGQYDINVQVDLNNRATSGVNFFVSGNEIHDPRGWGQYVFGNDESSVYPDYPASGLNWWLIKQDETIEYTRDGSTFLTLAAGANSVEIKASWCDNLFGSIQLLEAGTDNVALELSAADVTSRDQVTPGMIGAVWAPSNFKSVSMNTNGTISWSIDAAGEGNYLLNVNYQNPDAATAGTIEVDGTQVATVSFESEPDSTGLQAVSSQFAMTAGAHTLTLTGSGINVDYVDLFSVSTYINSNNKLPEGFALDQNYPNPFNPVTNIRFSLDKSRDVNLTVYNVLGQKVATLINTRMNAGSHNLQFKAGKLASGIYFYRLKADDIITQRKMMLLK